MESANSPYGLSLSLGLRHHFHEFFKITRLLDGALKLYVSKKVVDVDLLA
jgi:hypothetical protein